MPFNPSEEYLLSLAERTFLKLWAIPNTYYAPSRELTDLIVPFGDDIVIISDKACRFDFDGPLEIAWPRWYRAAVLDSVRQLKTAMQRLNRAPDSFFTDVAAKSPVPLALGPTGAKRFHLVGIARPDPDPSVVPSQWVELRYGAHDTTEPFRIGKIEVNGHHVHIFDGPTIDLLLQELDTAPDFIAYLEGRAERLAEAGEYEFVERDLLGAALIGWDRSPTRLPSLPPLEAVVDGLWERYSSGKLARHRRKADLRSRIIDALIEQVDGEFAAGRMLYEKPAFAEHEQAMRLLAAESRFARRIVAHELYDILDEPDQSTFWASTVPSPTMPRLRYVWLTYPKRPDDMDEGTFDQVTLQHLKHHVLVAQALFDQTLVLGICLPNRAAPDTANFMVLHDGSKWTEQDRREALELKARGIFDRLEANERLHVP